MRRIAFVGMLGALAAIAWSDPSGVGHTPAGTAAAGQQLYATFNLPPRTIETFRVKCPRGYVATGGAVVRLGTGHVLLGSRRLGNQLWDFRVSSLDTSEAQQVTFVVTCVREQDLVSRTATSRAAVVLDESEIRRAVLRCPRGHAPGGTGFSVAPGQELRGGREQTPPEGARIDFTTLHPVRGGWLFELANRGVPARVSLLAICVRRRVPGYRVLVARRTSQVQVPEEIERRFVRRCPRGWLAIHAGYAAGAREVLFTSSHLLRDGRAEWRAVSTAPGAQNAQLDLLCLRKARARN